MPPLLKTLKFQFALALLLLSALVSGTLLFGLNVLQQQRNDDVLLRLAGQLQLAEQHLAMQAMNYKDNAPRDFQTYYRDIRLYYRDLQANRQLFGNIIHAFANGHFTRALTGHQMDARYALDRNLNQASQELVRAWESFEKDLSSKLGPNDQEPRLEWAAEVILERHPDLEAATANLLHVLESGVDRRAHRATITGRAVMIAIFVVGLLTLLWFYSQVLRPINRAVSGFRLAATGDFAHQVPVLARNELGQMTESFNTLSCRLDAILNLLTRLQEGNSLQDTLQGLSTKLPIIVPMDWIGILVQAPDGSMVLRHAFSDGTPDQLAQDSFELERTLLQECLQSRQPLHIPNVNETALIEPAYRFLNVLAGHGRHDAVFMPIVNNEPVTAVLVLGSRHPNSYRSEHLQLLQNLSHLMSVSLGRTVTLMESTRLAAIGQFASGIVHEIRNPLATISLALEHFNRLESLPPSAGKRAQLAADEVTRLSHLLDDILLYAKPLQLTRKAANWLHLLEEVVSSDMFADAEINLNREQLQTLPETLLDGDRIKQVLLNLLKNAVDANGADPRGVTISANSYGQDYSLFIENGGPGIPAGQLERLFEPFFTSKAGGTGLGLPIVRRIIEAHGGTIKIDSNESGTKVTVRLPRHEAA